MINAQTLTGKPSIDRPWLKFYPEGIDQMRVPECTLLQLLKDRCPGEDVVAMHYYGVDITWKTVFQQAERVARALRALGFGENDQIPVFLRAVPEFIYLLLAAEKIGASLLCRDNTLQENVDAVRKSGSKAMIAHTFLSQTEWEAYQSGSSAEKVVLLSPCYSGDRKSMPIHIKRYLDELYPAVRAHGPETMSWDEFLALGEQYTGEVAAPVDINRPLLRAYTSGSTGPSKHVIHSAHSMIGVIYQMSLYGNTDGFRPLWLVTHLPPSLVAVVVSMILTPLASNKLLVLDPFCDACDVDLEMMRYRPNIWPGIPVFFNYVMHNGRVPDDYDMSHLFAVGFGCEPYNNIQMDNLEKFLHAHNCNVTLTSSYGSSEAGSSMALPCMAQPIRNGNVGIPLPMSTMSIFKPGTQEELGYNQLGEICKKGPGNMLGYDNPAATAKALQRHADGDIWLHTGDIGYVNEDGIFYALSRGASERYGGGELAFLPMENLVADAHIEGINDEFFVIVPDANHPGYFLPYLFVILKDGYTVKDIQDKVMDCLKPHMYPVDIIELDERPFFHFKTNRIGLSRMLKSEKVV